MALSGKASGFEPKVYVFERVYSFEQKSV
jgi:hypothetical protein